MTALLVMIPGRMTAFPPFLQAHCTLHSFCLDGDAGRIQAALDATFHAPSGGAVRYEAIGAKLFVSIAEIGHMSSTDPGDRARGWLSEIEVAVWVMARKAGTLALRWLPLWMLVDSAGAMVTGREVYGFPKQLGRFDFSPEDDRNRAFAVDAFVLPTFTADTQARWAPLIALTPADAAPAPDAGDAWPSLTALARGVATRLETAITGLESGLLDAARGVIDGGVVTMGFLKQFPDAADPRRACYQAIIEADTKVMALRSAGLTPTPYMAQIHSWASHPLRDQLGLADGAQQVGHGVVVDFDFEIGLGREVWRA